MTDSSYFLIDLRAGGQWHSRLPTRNQKSLFCVGERASFASRCRKLAFEVSANAARDPVAAAAAMNFVNDYSRESCREVVDGSVLFAVEGTASPILKTPTSGSARRILMSLATGSGEPA